MRTNKRALGRELEALLLADLKQDFPDDEVFVAVHVHSKALVVIETLLKKSGDARSMFTRIEYRDRESKDWVAREVMRNVRAKLEAAKGGVP